MTAPGGHGMHLAMHNWMRSEPLETSVARMARYGYESIEIAGEPEQYNTAEVRRLLQAYGIRCWGGVTLMLGGRDLISRDPARREATVQYAKACATMVKELDGYELTVVPAAVGKIKPEGSPEAEWQWVVEGMKEIYDHAYREGVRLAIEPIHRFRTHFINRASQALALAEQTGPECGVCLDVFHINIEEADPFQAIRDMGNRLVNIHVADTNRMACGMGHWDWERMIDTLRDMGYDGALAVEFVAPLDHTPLNPYPDALEISPMDIGADQLKYIEDQGSSTLSDSFYSWLVEASATRLLPLLR
jgi:D-psicose/D-tagatose/L-ribulose 3-epimerase